MIYFPEPTLQAEGIRRHGIIVLLLVELKVVDEVLVLLPDPFLLRASTGTSTVLLPLP